MIAFSGPQGKGAMRKRREQKQLDADQRNEQTRPEDRRRYRLDPAARLLVDVFAAETKP